MDLLKAYANLLDEYGSQDWWPSPRDFQPKEWEVCVGAILTQNTNWKNVEKALDNLKFSNILTPHDLAKTNLQTLESLIRSSGYYRQKAKRLKVFAEFILTYGSFDNFRKNVTREELLKVKGIGFETADSILLYACNRMYFVIDAYTKRFVKSLGIKTKEDYESLRTYFENSLPKDPEVYKQFHALIVEWGKRNSSKKP